MDFYNGQADNTEELGRFEPVPPGEYVMVVNEVKLEESKNSHGCRFYTFEFEIVQGPQSGRKLWRRAICNHPNSAKAVTLGRAFTKAVALATARTEVIKAPSQFYGKPFQGKVTLSKNKDGEHENEVQNAFPLGQTSGQAPYPAQQAVNQQGYTPPPQMPQGQQPQQTTVGGFPAQMTSHGQQPHAPQPGSPADTFDPNKYRGQMDQIPF